MYEPFFIPHGWCGNLIIININKMLAKIKEKKEKVHTFFIN